MTTLIVYLLIGLAIGCVRQIFSKRNAKSQFQEALSEELEKLAKKKEIDKWENEERRVFSANPNSGLWARAALASEKDVIKMGEGYWTLMKIAGWTLFWGPVLVETVLSKILGLFKKTS